MEKQSGVPEVEQKKSAAELNNTTIDTKIYCSSEVEREDSNRLHLLRKQRTSRDAFYWLVCANAGRK